LGAWAVHFTATRESRRAGGREADLRFIGRVATGFVDEAVVAAEFRCDAPVGGAALLCMGVAEHGVEDASAVRFIALERAPEPESVAW